LYCSKILTSSSKAYPLSVPHKNIVAISLPNVVIPALVLSGVVEIASSIKVIPSNTQTSSSL